MYVFSPVLPLFCACIVVVSHIGSASLGLTLERLNGELPPFAVAVLSQQSLSIPVTVMSNSTATAVIMLAPIYSACKIQTTTTVVGYVSSSSTALTVTAMLTGLFELCVADTIALRTSAVASGFRLVVLPKVVSLCGVATSESLRLPVVAPTWSKSCEVVFAASVSRVVLSAALLPSCTSTLALDSSAVIFSLSQSSSASFTWKITSLTAAAAGVALAPHTPSGAQLCFRVASYDSVKQSSSSQASKFTFSSGVTVNILQDFRFNGLLADSSSAPPLYLVAAGENSIYVSYSVSTAAALEQTFNDRSFSLQPQATSSSCSSKSSVGSSTVLSTTPAQNLVKLSLTYPTSASGLRLCMFFDGIGYSVALSVNVFSYSMASAVFADSFTNSRQVVTARAAAWLHGQSPSSLALAYQGQLPPDGQVYWSVADLASTCASISVTSHRFTISTVAFTSILSIAADWFSLPGAYRLCVGVKLGDGAPTGALPSLCDLGAVAYYVLVHHFVAIGGESLENTRVYYDYLLPTAFVGVSYAANSAAFPRDIKLSVAIGSSCLSLSDPMTQVSNLPWAMKGSLDDLFSDPAAKYAIWGMKNRVTTFKICLVDEGLLSLGGTSLQFSPQVEFLTIRVAGLALSDSGLDDTGASRLGVLAGFPFDLPITVSLLSTISNTSLAAIHLQVKLSDGQFMCDKPTESFEVIVNGTLSGTLRFYGLTTKGAVGSRSLCIRTTRDLADASISGAVGLQEFSPSTLKIYFIDVTSINGVSLPGTASSPPPEISISSYVTTNFSLVGKGLAGVTTFGVYQQNSSFPLVQMNVSDDLFCWVELRPERAGSFNFTLQIGSLITTRYPIAKITAIGITTIGWSTATQTIATFAGTTQLFPVEFSTAPEVMPDACLQPVLSSTTTAPTTAPTTGCSCDARILVTLTNNSIMVDLTAAVGLSGAFSLCLRAMTATTFFSTPQAVVVLPRPASIAGVRTYSNLPLQVLIGTVPTVDVVLSAAVQTVPDTGVELVLLAVPDTFVSPTEDCSALYSREGATAAAVQLSDVLNITLSTGTLKYTSAASLDLTSCSTEKRRLCGALASPNTTKILLRQFTFDLGLYVECASLEIEGLMVMMSTKPALSVHEAATTPLYITHHSGSLNDTLTTMQFMISENVSCTSARGALLGIQIDNVVNLPRFWIPAGLPPSTQFELCGKFATSTFFTAMGFTVYSVRMTSIDSQNFFSLSAAGISTDVPFFRSSGVMVMAGFERTIVLSGLNVGRACWTMKLIPSLADGCGASNASGAVYYDSARVPSARSTSRDFKVAADATPRDFQGICFLLLPSCGNGALSDISYKGMLTATYVAFVDVLGVGVNIAAYQSTNDQQYQIFAHINMTTVLPVYQQSYANVSITSLHIQTVSDPSCNVSSLHRTVPAVLDGSSINFDVPRGLNDGAYTVCMTHAPSAGATAELYSAGMTLLTSALIVGGASLDSYGTISVIQDREAIVSVTGSNVGRLRLYVAVTDGLCSEPLTGINYVEVSREPVRVESCDGAIGSATFTAAKLLTTNPLRLCVAGHPSSNGGSIPADALHFMDAGIWYEVTEAKKLIVVTEPSATTAIDNKLTLQPELGIQSASGARIQTLPGQLRVLATWNVIYPVSKVLSEEYVYVLPTGATKINFADATRVISLISAVYGYEYVINFTAPDQDYESVLSAAVRKGPCRSEKLYGVMFTDRCEDCPAHASCSGTASFLVSGSYWRANNASSILYDCTPPYGSSQCLSNTTTGQCTPGHTGPRCTSCLDGYGKSFGVCVICDPKWLAALWVAAAAVISVAIVSWLTNSTRNAAKGDLRPILMKLLTSHVVLASTIGEFSRQLPKLLQVMFEVFRRGSRPSAEFASVDCAFNPSFYAKYVFVNLAPPGATVFAALVCCLGVPLRRYLADRRYRKKKEERDSRPADAPPYTEEELDSITEEEEEHKSDIMTRLPVGYLFSITIIIVLFFVYPTLVQEGLGIFKCDEIDFGTMNYDGVYVSDVKSVFFFDRQLLCTSEKHRQYQMAAYGLTVVWVFGIPTFSILFVLLLRRPKDQGCLAIGRIRTRRMFLFLLSGYRGTMWWWEICVMMRKAAIISIVVFVNDSKLQAYLALWLLLTTLTLHLIVRPYECALLDLLETFSLSVIIFTLNSSLMYEYLPETSPDPRIAWCSRILTVTLFIVNVFTVLLFVVLIGKEYLRALQKWIREHDKGVKKKLWDFLYVRAKAFSELDLAWGIERRLGKKKKDAEDDAIKEILDEANEKDDPDVIKKKLLKKEEERKLKEQGKIIPPQEQQGDVSLGGSKKIGAAPEGGGNAEGSTKPRSGSLGKLQQQSREHEELSGGRGEKYESNTGGWDDDSVQRIEELEELVTSLRQKYITLLAHQKSPEDASAKVAVIEELRNEREVLRRENAEMKDALKHAAVVPPSPLKTEENGDMVVGEAERTKATQHVATSTEDLPGPAADVMMHPEVHPLVVREVACTTSARAKIPMMLDETAAVGTRSHGRSRSPAVEATVALGDSKSYGEAQRLHALANDLPAADNELTREKELLFFAPLPSTVTASKVRLMEQEAQREWARIRDVEEQGKKEQQRIVAKKIESKRLQREARASTVNTRDQRPPVEEPIRPVSNTVLTASAREEMVRQFLEASRNNVFLSNQNELATNNPSALGLRRMRGHLDV